MKMQKRLLTYIKDRMVLILLIVCILSCAIASAVYAKYVKDLDSEVDVNIVGEGDLEIVVVKNADGSYTIKHDTNSKIPAYIRFAIMVSWEGTEGIWYIDPASVDYTVPNAQLLSEDGYYYCVYDGRAEIDVETVLSGITVTTTATPPAEGYEFSVQIVAEAIQCMPQDVVETAWGARFVDGAWEKLTP